MSGDAAASRSPRKQNRNSGPQLAARAYSHRRRRDNLCAWRQRAERVAVASSRRCDRQATMREIYSAIADRTDPRTMEAWPGIDTLCAVTGRCRRTVQDATRAYEEEGLLICIEPGSTPAYPHSGYRRLALEKGTVNLRRTWILAVPEDDDDGSGRDAANVHPMAPATSSPPSSPPTGHGQDLGLARCADSSPAPPLWPGDAGPCGSGPKARRRREPDPAAASVLAALPVLRRARGRRVRKIVARWVKHGWTAAGIVTAAGRLPGGELHLYDAPVADPARWLEHRLSFWLGPDGEPGPSPAERLDQAAAGHWSGILGAAVTPATRPHIPAGALAPAVDLAGRASRIRERSLREHVRSLWQPGARPGDPGNWEAIARGQAAESRRARGEDGARPARLTDEAELADVATPGPVIRDPEERRRILALALAAESRARRS